MTAPACGCCRTAAEARTRHGNRPWLPAIDYRLGTFASFRTAILDELSRTMGLRALRSRVSDDYAITTVDLWAAVADVLTFYSERTANEAFLRTATLRDSVLRLVRVLDYQLAPGAAATTSLAFTLERDAAALIPAGTRVQSVPAQGETPQKFETLEPLAANGALNRLRVVPRPKGDRPLEAGSTVDIAAPDQAAVSALGALASGQQVIVFASYAAEVLTVADVSARDDQLLITWRQPPSITFDETTDTWTDVLPVRQAYRLGRTFRLFGVDAPATSVVTYRTNAADPLTTIISQADTKFALGPSFLTELALDNRYPNLKPGADLLITAAQTPSNAFIARHAKVVAVADTRAALDAVVPPAGPTISGVVGATVTHITVDDADLIATRDLRDVTIYELLGDPLRFWPYVEPDHMGTQSVYIAGRRAGWSAIEVGRTIEKGRYKPGAVLQLSDLPVGRRVICVDERGATPTPATVTASTLVGRDVRVGPTPDDPTSVVKLGLVAPGATPTTVLVSAPLATPLLQSASGTPKLTVTIGAVPTQTLGLDPALVGGGSLAETAVALQAAIRAALPGSATFAGATVRDVSLWSTPGSPSDDALYVAAGVPDDAIAFGPTEDDMATVAQLGLVADQVRFVDGFVSAPIDPSLVGVATTGRFQITYGIDEPIPTGFVIPATEPDIAGVASWILRPFDNALSMLREDDRLLIHAAPAFREVRSYIRLELDAAAPLALDASTAALLGNVAPASHGETIHNEIVGDGDASVPFEHFSLRKSPTTYVPSNTPGGIASSLQLFVNSAKWSEVPTLYGQSETAEVFVTRLGDDGVRTLQFGDGTTGARLPTGRLNVVATYRQGLGVAGRVRAQTLTNLLDRPTGVKGVTNPVPAEGGADPESLERARTTAPGTVRTFGRAISLRDFEDATLLAGEVAKATAAWVWTRRRRVVHVTVAGAGGAVFSPAKLAQLAATLNAERDPNQRLLLGNYVPVPVVIDATLTIEPTQVAADVGAAARAALLDALSFDRRAFLDAVDLSDVYAVLQGVTGVRAVDINRLDFKSTAVAFRNEHGVDPANGELQPRLRVLPARTSASASDVLAAELPVVEVPPLDLILLTSGGIVL